MLLGFLEEFIVERFLDYYGYNMSIKVLNFFKYLQHTYLSNKKYLIKEAQYFYLVNY